ncbi:hypothetical protein V2J09_008188 [Rumex salicifolius]
MQEKLVFALCRNDSVSFSDIHKLETADRSEEEVEEEEEEEEDEDESEEVVIIQPQTGWNRAKPGLRRVAPTISADETKVVHVERVLPNGDLYIGAFLGNAPHGAGKYLWSDGCMYEGEWRRGNATGKGRFSWPSGATYEGAFRSGRMHGYGIFTGTDGDTYRGNWKLDKKHGHGEKLYANGDVYDGSWKENLQDGEGKYVWSNGNVYAGEWKNGVISGKGLLIWANGNKYEGFWENGVPKGAGAFTRASDGSTYAGNWGNESPEHDALPAAKRRASVDEAGGRLSVSERAVNFPRICIWEDDEDGGDITCDIIDNLEVSKLYRDAINSSYNGNAPGHCKSLSPRPYWSGGGDDQIKKPGQTISKGHKNYDLMLNLQLGIRHSVGKHASKGRQLKPSDFEPREKYWTRFPPEGSKSTPPHQSVDFKWKDYCPLVFRYLRQWFGIDPADYMLAICGSDALREFCSPGKSGSSFYLTQDDRFMIKTVKKCEVKVLIRMLPSYYCHVSTYKNTLVTKFFGVHCVKPIGGQKTRFIVMGNLFHSEYRIHKRFDLKGSSHGRSTDKPEGEIDETTTLKDLDLNFMFRLQKSWFEELISQVDRDCEFLEAARIMDYSLLIGVHFRDDCPSDEMAVSPKGNTENRIPRQGQKKFIAESPDTEWMIGQIPFIRLGANMPARAEQVTRTEFDQHGSVRNNGTPRNGGGTTPSYLNTPQRLNGDGNGEVLDVILYFGIIDILQDYDISKKIEHAYKSLQVDPTSISAVDPKLYSKRFRDFLSKIFVEDE